MVKTVEGYKSIGSLTTQDQIIGYDHERNQYYSAPINAIKRYDCDSFIQIITSNEVIQTGPYQKMYLHNQHDWVFAQDIQPGDCLRAHTANKNLVINVENIAMQTTLYEITVERSHFCTTHSDIVVHNVDPVTCGTALTIAAANPIGLTILGGAFLTSALCLTLYTLWKNEFAKRPQQTHHASDTDNNMCLPAFIPDQELSSLTQQKNSKEKSESDAQAPGKPTQKDGYVPPKNYDGKKVKTKKGYGWKDENGKVWIPTGPKGHGGPHWDVQSKDGKTYENIMPGGRIRREN
jgi:hypothetical protein